MSTPPADSNLVKQARPRLWSPVQAEPLEDTVSASAGPSGDGTVLATRSVARLASTPALSLVSTDQPDADAGRPEPVSLSLSVRYSPTIKQLPPDERPRERLFAHGPSALSTAELIAILIRVGSAERSAVSLGEHLLAHFGNIGEVAGATVEQLARVKGIGNAKAAQIKAAIEMGNRVSIFTSDARLAISDASDVANLLMPDLRFLKKETLKSVLLDTKNRVMGVKTVSVGDLGSSIVHPREVFKDAVVASAAAIILAHNHPSGDPNPSAEDVNISKRLIASGEILGIDLLDHIIIGDGIFVSLKERGLI